MFKINFVSSEIYVQGSKKRYGFKYKFNRGLNIITGQNSSGKSSVLSCIYYNLGMEQLLGMSTSKLSLLDKCLTSEFIYKDTTYSVTQSIIRLEIENDKGDIALLERYAVSPVDGDKSVITIYENGKNKKYYIHSHQDHLHKRGFYTWLQSFIGIELPTDNETNKKTLYLQNLFSVCFIEQTKGWSDFMSQMPSFNIKDAKRKLVEYLLSLDCLDDDINKDKLTNERALIINDWNQAVKNFECVDSTLSYKVNGLSCKFEKSRVDSLINLQLKINIESEWVDVNTAKRNIERYLKKLKADNRKKEKRKDLSSLSERRKELKLQLLKLNRIKLSLERDYTTEKFKIDNYIINLSRLEEERLNIIGARKVDELLSELSDSESCPLCDSTITIKSLDKEITLNDYESSIKFIDSKISMIKSYLCSFNGYEEDYLKNSCYYESLIYEIRNEIDNIDRDLNSNADNTLCRSKIYAELVNDNLLTKINFLLEKFDLFKIHINDLNTKVVNIDKKIKEIKQFFNNDDKKIVEFQRVFRKYLSDFKYTSNQIDRVNINNKKPFKVFPSVFNVSAGSAQPIRLASSASDFIRAEWAFYLALMEISKIHPGVLIFDEPGQHAMSLDSMVRLLEKAEKIKDRQLIFAISKLSRGYDQDKVKQKITINELTHTLTSYKEIEIDSDSQKLVSEL